MAFPCMQNISADLKDQLQIHGNMQNYKIHFQLIFITTHTQPSFHTTVLKKQRSITLGSLVYDPMQHRRKVASYEELHSSKILLLLTSTTLNLICPLHLFLFFKQLSSLHRTECLSDILYGLHYSTNRSFVSERIFSVNSLVVPHILEMCIHSTTITTSLPYFQLQSITFFLLREESTPVFLKCWPSSAPVWKIKHLFLF